jgi:glutamate-5-semialdehyde dehydrogenase
MSQTRALAERAKAASKILATANPAHLKAALQALAHNLRRNQSQILAANAVDMQAAQDKPEAFRDRLFLNAARLEHCARAVEHIAHLPSPVGEVTAEWERPNGLRIRKVRIPLGVVMMVYEARPTVTSDAAALCLKSGNAVILRGGREALQTNLAFAPCISEALQNQGLPMAAVQLVPDTQRESMVELLRCDGLIDLCIPRGGPGLIEFVAEHARIPVVRHAAGVCHVYVHEKADADKAIAIVVNSKTSRPGVCNSAECLQD